MKNKLTIFLLSMALSSCQLVETYKGKEAIKLVQSQKFGIMNAYAINMYNVLKSGGNYANLSIVKPDATNLETANLLANEFTSDHFAWKATFISDNIFLVSFYDEGDKKGLVWDADMDNQVVRCVSCNVDLLKKYNLSIDTPETIQPLKKHKKK
jgi:hypothetical protein